MQFFQELFLDPNSSQDTTPIPQFRLNYGIHTEAELSAFDSINGTLPSDAYYFMRSKRYFEIKKNAIARNGQNNADLPVQAIGSIAFNVNDTLFSKFIDDHVGLFKRKFEDLAALDQKIVAAFAIAIFAPVIPFLPFAFLITGIAWIAAIYFLNQRAELNNRYQDSLTLLAATCNWALGPKTDRKNDPETLANHPSIRGMMDCLYPVLSKKQVAHLIADDIESHYLTALDKRDQAFQVPCASFFAGSSDVNKIVRTELEQTALKQRGAEFVRCLYGFNRGNNSSELGRVVVNLICVDLVSAVSNGVRAYCTPKIGETVSA